MPTALAKAPKSSRLPAAPKALAPKARRAQASTARNGLNFLGLYRADPIEHITLVKQGVPATAADQLAKRMNMSKDKLLLTLGLARATVDRNVRSNKPLSTQDSSRLIGMARLVGQVQAMVEESGHAEGFDAGTWLAQWLEEPLPALAGSKPSAYMDTSEGQAMVAGLLARMQSGAYA